MTRDELEHIIRASAEITDQYEFIIVGSQSILGPVPHPHEVFKVSMEADIYPKNAPSWLTRLTAQSARDHGFTRSSATTHRA